jgi:predicted DNA-binding protein
MSMGLPTPVRLSVSADQRLSAISARNGVSKAELIRLAVDNFLQEIEHSGSIQFTKRIENPAPEPIAAEADPSRTIRTIPRPPITYKKRRK